MHPNRHRLHIPPRHADSLRYGRKDCGKLSVFYVQFPYALLWTLEKHFYDFFIVYHHTASFPASPIYYGFSGEYYIKSQTFSKKLYHIFLNSAWQVIGMCFRRFAGGSPAFLAVWGGQWKSATAFRRLRFAGWELFYELFCKITPAGNAARKPHSPLAGICDTRDKRG